jgi:hypothetical protein
MPRRCSLCLDARASSRPPSVPRLVQRWGCRCSAIVAVVVLGSAFLAPAALAGKPDRVRLGPFESFVDSPGVACPEAIAPEGVRNTYVGGNQALTVFDNGRIMFTGSHSEEITNVATGKSVVLDAQRERGFFGSAARRVRGRAAERHVRILVLPGRRGPRRRYDKPHLHLHGQRQAGVRRRHRLRHCVRIGRDDGGRVRHARVIPVPARPRQGTAAFA